MSAKTSSVQQAARRTPLSLSTSIKPMKPNEKNDNNKKESTNNQKTDNLKKDTQPERKLSADKKQPSTESKRSSSTSSSDSKKHEDIKIIKNDDKKSQNGLNGNGIKDKPTSNEGGVKSKPEASSNGNASKKESQKPNDKKKESVAVEVKNKNDNNEKATDKNKITKNEDNKNKSDDNKEKAVDVLTAPILEQEKTKEKKENELKSDEKINETTTSTMSPENAPVKGDKNEEVVAMTDLISHGKDLPLKNKVAEEITVLKTPSEDKIVEETSKLEKTLPEDLDDVEMMEPLQLNEEEPSSNDFLVSTPAKNLSPKESLNLFEEPAKFSPKSEIKPPREPLVQTPDRKSCPRSFSSISGRRAIRPIGDYTFSGNLQIRESYRKINTELDFTSSSLNVTVGSEVPNNDSFSFFSRSRKRDRSSPSHQSVKYMKAELSPKSPKRARIDGGMSGFFNAMASPITMLRARLARATVQSTPKKQIIDSIEQEIVENVSAIIVDEDLTATEEEQTFNPDSTVADTNEECEKEPVKCSQTPVEEDDDIKIKETITPTSSQAKKKCSIM